MCGLTFSLGENMIEYNDNRETTFGRTGASAVPSVSYDAGLRAYMLKIYNLMALGLGMTGLTAFFVATVPALQAIFLTSPMAYVVMFAPLAFMMVFSFGIYKMQASTAKMLFVAFSVVMGLSMASIFLVYTSESIARTFFISAGTFGAMSLWGYTTKRDLTAFGSFMTMGLFGIVIASLVGIFFQSSALQFAISVIGVVVFTGLIAWDTQKLKDSYSAHSGVEATNKLAVMGALNLYLDFINLFMMLLRFFGDRR
jgi:FtsH-binding integral membrane protein